MHKAAIQKGICRIDLKHRAKMFLNKHIQKYKGNAALIDVCNAGVKRKGMLLCFKKRQYNVTRLPISTPLICHGTMNHFRKSLYQQAVFLRVFKDRFITEPVVASLFSTLLSLSSTICLLSVSWRMILCI